MLDAIKAGGNNDFGTTLAIYERIVGPGKVADLFAQPDEEDQVPGAGPPGRQDTVSFAQQVMDDNTTKLDTEEEMRKQKKEKKGLFSAFGRKTKS